MNDPDPDVGEPLADGDGDVDEGDGDGATDEGAAGGVGALVVGGAVVGGAGGAVVGVGLVGAWLDVAAGAAPAIPAAGPAPPVTLACAKPPASVNPLAPIIVTMAASGITRRINLVAIGPLLHPVGSALTAARSSGTAAPAGTSRCRVAWYRPGVCPIPS